MLNPLPALHGQASVGAVPASRSTEVSSSIRVRSMSESNPRGTYSSATRSWYTSRPLVIYESRTSRQRATHPTAARQVDQHPCPPYPRGANNDEFSVLRLRCITTARLLTELTYHGPLYVPKLVNQHSIPSTHQYVPGRQAWLIAELLLLTTTSRYIEYSSKLTI